MKIKCLTLLAKKSLLSAKVEKKSLPGLLFPPENAAVKDYAYAISKGILSFID